MNVELIITLISGLFTTFAGLLAALLANKQKEKDKIQQEKLNNIADIVHASATEARARALESIVEKIPEGKKIEEFERVLHDKIQTYIDEGVVIRIIGEKEGSFIQDLVNSYHHQALSQARVQFWFSVFAASVGFIFILSTAPLGGSAGDITNYLKILPGVVIDAVALLFFKQAEQTRERATALYDRLRTDNQMARSHSLVESIEDLQIKSVVKAQIALHIAGLKPKEIDLPIFLSGNKDGKNP